MSAKKTIQRKVSKNSYKISYDTKMIIVVLLLVLFYPLGVVFMWAWMNTWPLWLKIILTLPVFFALFAFFGLMVFVGSFVRKGVMYQRLYNQRSFYQQVVPSVSQQMSPTTTY